MSKEQIYKEAAEKLWGLLDDIDTLPDMIHPTSLKGYISFYKASLVRTELRHEILVSDGYNLHVPEKCIQKIVESACSEDQSPVSTMVLNVSPPCPKNREEGE